VVINSISGNSSVLDIMHLHVLKIAQGAHMRQWRSGKKVFS